MEGASEVDSPIDRGNIVGSVNRNKVGLNPENGPDATLTPNYYAGPLVGRLNVVTNDTGGANDRKGSVRSFSFRQ